jgi:hypothetical protein
MTEKRYAVYSADRYPDGSPAGTYETLEAAARHCETVTYPMAVVDTKFESRGFVYTNWETLIPADGYSDGGEPYTDEELATP